MDRQQYERMTAAEMLEYYKNDVFAKMGIEIEGLQNRDADYQKWAKVSVADQQDKEDMKAVVENEAPWDFCRLDTIVRDQLCELVEGN